jgi:hypothetical protein
MNNALVVSNLIGIIFAITIPRAAYAGIRHHLPQFLARCQKHWLLLFTIDLPGIDLPLPVIAPHEEDYAAPRDHQVA